MRNRTKFMAVILSQTRSSFTLLYSRPTAFGLYLWLIRQIRKFFFLLRYLFANARTSPVWLMLIKGYPHESWEHVDDTIRIGTRVPIKFQPSSREFLSYASSTAIEGVTQHITVRRNHMQNSRKTSRSNINLPILRQLKSKRIVCGARRRHVQLLYIFKLTHILSERRGV